MRSRQVQLRLLRAHLEVVRLPIGVQFLWREGVQA